MENVKILENGSEPEFEVMNTGDSVEFSDYVDPRDWYYFESTLAEIWEWAPESTKTDEFDNDFYDDLELQFWESDGKEKYDYVKMKNFQKNEDKVNEKVMDVFDSTKWSLGNDATKITLKNVLSGENIDDYDLAA